MFKIILFCGTGISSNMLAAKMRELMKKMKINSFVEAYSEIGFEKYLDKADVVLVGPQIRYLFPKFKKACDERGIPIDVISNADYGAINAENVINMALKMIENNKR
ncbi:PTS sugar transporter subunit IIB [Clostridium sp.]|uniref:PTS sugar transporter subunit IIB n=1 Tax=Clostridium sp. TaxID=1506 RepID=UPI002635AD04|nr:PTS sugar transporter subunit IIB [Clostridium sp.]